MKIEPGLSYANVSRSLKRKCLSEASAVRLQGGRATKGKKGEPPAKGAVIDPAKAAEARELMKKARAMQLEAHAAVAAATKAQPR